MIAIRSSIPTDLVTKYRVYNLAHTEPMERKHPAAPTTTAVFQWLLVDVDDILATESSFETMLV